MAEVVVTIGITDLFMIGPLAASGIEPSLIWLDK